MWFESLLVFILFKFKKSPNIPRIRVVSIHPSIFCLSSLLSYKVIIVAVRCLRTHTHTHTHTHSCCQDALMLSVTIHHVFGLKSDSPSCTTHFTLSWAFLQVSTQYTANLYTTNIINIPSLFLTHTHFLRERERERGNIFISHVWWCYFSSIRWCCYVLFWDIYWREVRGTEKDIQAKRWSTFEVLLYPCWGNWPGSGVAVCKCAADVRHTGKHCHWTRKTRQRAMSVCKRV